MSTLISGEYTQLEHPRPTIVLYTRTAAPYPTAESIATDFEAVLGALEGLDTASMGLVVDLRAAKGRNDPTFEQTHAGYRKRLMRGFRLVAMVVQTVVGKMQLSRYAQEDGVDLHMFDSVEAAEAWLGERL